MKSLLPMFYRLNKAVAFIGALPIAAWIVVSAQPVNNAPAGPGKRSPYSVPLAKLSVALDEETHDLKSVRIFYEGSDDYSVITPYDDEHIHMTAQGREKEVHREQPELAYLTSEFELGELEHVNRTFIAALAIMENDLHHQRWDRLLYLDSYLPRFLRGYANLCDGIREFHDPMPRNARIPEEAFDVSINSPKSDDRINMWKNETDYAIKLRIVAKELAFQLKEWNAIDKAKKLNASDLFLATKVKEAFGLFVHIYFNIKPPPKINLRRGRHL
jgi:hypothetical protein